VVPNKQKKLKPGLDPFTISSLDMARPYSYSPRAQKPRLHNMFVQPVVNRFDNRLNVCIHDTNGCQTGFTTGCIVYTAGCQTGCTTRFDNWLNE